MFPDENHGVPESFFVFIVGVNEQWENGRAKHGDIALFNTYIAAGVPSDQIVFVKDKDATKSNCEKRLTQFLKVSTPSSTLVFYYGGHGQPVGFETHEELWNHEDVVNLIDSNFCGDRVLMLIDCCASGNMFRWLQPQRALRHSYVCFMSTVPYTEAGAAWTMTSSWINCITCSDGSLPLSRVIDFLSDETARIKGDLLIVYLSKSVKITSCAWLPQRASHKSIKKLKWRRLKNHIPSGAKVTSRWSSGDRVYYKHPGGACQLQQEYIPPVWLPATINSITQERRLHLQVIDPVSQLKWNIEVSKKELLNDLYMASTNMVPENFFKAQCKLATHFNFFDYSLTPATAVNALGEDGKTYDAMVVDWRVVDWKKYLASGSCNDSHPHGPYVALYWLHSKTASILPLCRIVDHSFGRSDSLTAPDGNSLVTIRPEDAQRKVFLKSIESCGKTVVSAADVLGTSKLSCFWPEDGEWYDAEALDPSSVSLEVLATHVMFTVSGKYCPAYYEDGTIYLTPLHYVRKRKSCPFSLSWLCSIER